MHVTTSALQLCITGLYNVNQPRTCDQSTCDCWVPSSKGKWWGKCVHYIRLSNWFSLQCLLSRASCVTYIPYKVHSHWRVRVCGPALRVPHYGPAPNVHTWIKRECSHWRMRMCGPACGKKTAEWHAVIFNTRKLVFGLFMTFWGLEIKFPIR